MLSAKELADTSAEFAKAYGGQMENMPMRPGMDTTMQPIGAWDGKSERQYLGDRKSFRDPFYASAASSTEAKLGLPDGLLHSIITNGERSNADQVSEAGARTVAQIIPSTRDAILKKYGVDAYLSPENAVEAAGLLLRDSLKRNGGDVERAVREYHGGTDPKNWGPLNNAYAGRVLTGMKVGMLDKLAADFSSWMKSNPAAAPLNMQPQPKESPDIEALSNEFSQWRDQQNPVNQIPGPNGDAVPQKQPTQEPGLLDKAVGVGEAGLSMVSGMTTGAVGAAGGFVKGLGSAILDGSFGTQDAVNAIGKATGEGADALTYHPRTQKGQEHAGAAGEVMQNLIPLGPLAGEFSQLARNGAQAARPIAEATAGRAVAQAKAATAGVSDAVSQIPTQVFGSPPKTQQLGSVGAAGTEAARQRVATAENLGFVGDSAMTEGQASRDFAQLRFERETAKNSEIGAPLRDRSDNQNAQAVRNLENWVDGTGAQTLDNVQTGNKVVDALTSMKEADKAKVRVLYDKAKKAGEMEEPVSTAPLVDFLNENWAGQTNAPILGTAGRELIRLGGAKMDDAGRFVPGELSLNHMESLRQTINKFAADNGPDIYASSGMRQAISTATEGAGGEAYKAARSAYIDLRNKYTNRGVVADLLKSKNGTQDPKIAAENVFQRVVLRGSKEDVSYMAKVLRAGGADGQQAWTELQGATYRYLREMATAGDKLDASGNPVFSASKFNSAVKSLDANHRLEIVLGKKEAQSVRDLNEVMRLMKTTPEGTVNTSNTASVLIEALTRSRIPGAEYVAKSIQDAQLRRKVMRALRMK